MKGPPKKKPSPEKRKSHSPRKPIDSLRDSHSLSYFPVDWRQISPPAQPPSTPRGRRRDRSRDRSLQRNRQSISRSPGRKYRRKSPSPRAPCRRTSR
ncbi:PREDICTED: serine/arginine repetitive matrix protein 2-like isoform X2 [Thamnophis sirtalis]|uniref:Serine/arginine repetitive matrix protein 2-like isoform X2 n=1 Tax=Thamnophis sirtalis TaxID=35019 RepID=A0A6I9X524_9SAUR|nr:PREDICTED: serine/arginine repetitive matrix protein 2-like isoform X2 [Thamnophis sirtalis]